MSEASETVALVCWKVWGGNRRVATPVSIPGMQGMLHAFPKNAERGGDLYYLSACGSGAVARLCIADFVGHGEAVAAFSAALERVFSAQIHRENPAAVLREVNRRTAKGTLDLISTGICISYNSLNGQLSFANAGHPPILHFPVGGSAWQPLSVKPPAANGLWNIPLGVDVNAQYTNGAKKLSPGDLLLLHTDGVNEARNARGEMFGHVLKRGTCAMPTGSEPVEAKALSLLNALDAHLDTLEKAEDDLTFVLLEVLPYQASGRYTLLVRNNWRRLRKYLQTRRHA